MSIVPGRDIPAAPQEWVDAVNERVNDENHADLCGCDAWPAHCASGYKPGTWDDGVALHIAVQVLDPLIREQIASETSLCAVGAALAATAASLEDHIARRADEVAEPRIRFERERADQMIATVRHEAFLDRQRKDDLVAELRRQLDVQVKAAARLGAAYSRAITTGGPQ